MEARSYDIQELVSLSGISRRTIYFYAQQAILPPPQGAGLAARYGEEHLLRLQLIPLLRRRGLRLDQIREEFTRLDPGAMRDLLAENPPFPGPALPQPLPGLPTGQSSVRYDLPGGLVLFSPAHLPPAEAARVQRILRAAFAGPLPFFPMEPSGFDEHE